MYINGALGKTHSLSGNLIATMIKETQLSRFPNRTPPIGLTGERSANDGRIAVSFHPDRTDTACATVYRLAVLTVCCWSIVNSEIIETTIIQVEVLCYRYIYTPQSPSSNGAEADGTTNDDTLPPQVQIGAIKARWSIWLKIINYFYSNKLIECSIIQVKNGEKTSIDHVHNLDEWEHRKECAWDSHKNHLHSAFMIIILF